MGREIKPPRKLPSPDKSEIFPTGKWWLLSLAFYPRGKDVLLLPRPRARGPIKH
jgi:hypothetical protein